jgi:hypothetical protein
VTGNEAAQHNVTLSAAIMPLSQQEMTMFKKDENGTPELLTDEQLELVSGGDKDPLVPAAVIVGPAEVFLPGPIHFVPVVNVPPVRGLPPPV